MESPRKSKSESEISAPDCQTPPKPLIQEEDRNQNIPQVSGDELMRKILTPDRLKVPKAFKYPERYRSPTDAMMSPVTKGLLARNRKNGGFLLPPSINQTKIQDIRVSDAGLFQNEASSVGC